MKTAIYVRVSTNRQTQAQTIEQQLERLRRHLDLQSESLSADNIYRDDGYSGANLNRPGLDRLRDRVKAGVLDRVLLTSPDRLARNYVHQMVLIEEWERCGCKVEFLDRPMSQDPVWSKYWNVVNRQSSFRFAAFTGQLSYSISTFLRRLRARPTGSEETYGPRLRGRSKIRWRGEGVRTLAPPPKRPRGCPPRESASLG